MLKGVNRQREVEAGGRWGAVGQVGKAKTGGALHNAKPQHLQMPPPHCFPVPHQPQSMLCREVALYLRMVCVMDICRCSAGRRGSW